MPDTEVLAAIERSAVIAVLRAPSPDAALRTIDALVAGGITAVEVTYSTPDVPSVLVRARERHPDLLFGVGTVTEAAQVGESVDAGARFLVSPGYQASIAEAMLACGRVSMIGALTPSEVMAVRAAGADVVKLFPAGLGGPGFLKALREPFAGLRAIPTGGMSEFTAAAARVRG
jgi:2-dehydro-3-deoxyphosphogluconate aldolase/(4S)-4-hydroxy-2-oxoglutarate aldolase